MKREHKFLALFLLSLFAISIFASMVLAADATSTPVVNEPANQQSAVQAGTSTWEAFVNWWNSSSFSVSDPLRVGFAKVLLMILVTLIVFSITSFLPFIPEDKEYINWLISIVVAILSFIFVSPDDIRLLLVNYQALGIILTSIFPLIIVLTFTYKMREKNPNTAAIVNPIIIIGFLAYTVIKILTFKPSSDLSIPELKYAYGLTAIILVLWFFLEKWLYFKIFRALLGGDLDKANEYLLTDYYAQAQRLTDQKKTAEGETLIKVEAEINDLAKKIRKAGGTRFLG